MLLAGIFQLVGIQHVPLPHLQDDTIMYAIGIPARPATMRTSRSRRLQDLQQVKLLYTGLAKPYPRQFLALYATKIIDIPAAP